MTPPLQNGDHLTRAEFERRYDATPGLRKAELIEGEVYVPSPVNFEEHGEPHFHACGWLVLYLMSTPGARGAHNTSVRLDRNNEPQPDGLLIVAPEAGGQAQIDTDGCLVGAPELILEVAASSVSYDLHVKKRAYERNGIREYLVWRVLDRAIDWFVLRNGRYEPLPPDADGTYRSEVFPGLWLDPAALVRGDLVAMNQALQQGVASPEHAAFVERLQQARAVGE